MITTTYPKQSFFPVYCSSYCLLLILHLCSNHIVALKVLSHFSLLIIKHATTMASLIMLYRYLNIWSRDNGYRVVDIINCCPLLLCDFSQ